MAATVAFVVTASGLTLFGIGAAFWGLVGGIAPSLAPAIACKKRQLFQALMRI